MAFYVAAFLIVMGVALFVAAPLSGGLGIGVKAKREELELAHWEHEHALAVQGLRELEFDREKRHHPRQQVEAFGSGRGEHFLAVFFAIERDDRGTVHPFVDQGGDFLAHRHRKAAGRHVAIGDGQTASALAGQPLGRIVDRGTRKRGRG